MKSIEPLLSKMWVQARNKIFLWVGIKYNNSILEPLNLILLDFSVGLLEVLDHFREEYRKEVNFQKICSREVL